MTDYRLIPNTASREGPPSRKLRAAHKAEVEEWAQRIWTLPNLLFVDTETTGLTEDDRVVEIAIVNRYKRVLLNATLGTSRPLSPNAAAVNGLRSDDFEGALGWEDIDNVVGELLAASNVVAFRASFDQRMIEGEHRGEGRIDKTPPTWIDLKWPYSVWIGQWDYLGGDYLSQHLPSMTHDALDDARAMVDVLNMMRGQR